MSLKVSGATSINDQGLGFIDVPITVKVMCLQAKGIRDSNLVVANARPAEFDGQRRHNELGRFYGTLALQD